MVGAGGNLRWYAISLVIQKARPAAGNEDGADGGLREEEKAGEKRRCI